jgi:hypothetical protein
MQSANTAFYKKIPYNCDETGFAIGISVAPTPAAERP